MKRIMRGATATGLALALFAAGCGDTDSDAADGTGPADPPRSADLARPTFAERLALLPQRLADDEIVLQMADLDRAAELAGVTRPTDPADAEAVRSYLAALSSGATADGPAAVATLLPQQAVQAGNPDLAGFEAELGWSVLDVSWYVEHGNPPNVMSVYGGDFDSDQMTDAMGAPMPMRTPTPRRPTRRRWAPCWNRAAQAPDSPGRSGSPSPRYARTATRSSSGCAQPTARQRRSSTSCCSGRIH